MYSRIACLLLQVKTAMHAMEQSLFFTSKLEPSPDLRLFWKLRMRFLSTMNDLWSYFMTTVSCPTQPVYNHYPRLDAEY